MSRRPRHDSDAARHSGYDDHTSDRGRPYGGRSHQGRTSQGRREGRRAPKRRGVPADSIDPGLLDRDAKRVVTRLQQAGFEAYFVGGCVRDLLIGRRPKDFDVATDARPAEVRRLFRNCRIIGRRFKLAHIFYGDHIIETATFRAEPKDQPGDDDELLIVDDNEYGTAESDARRRDFTVNALFLDPTTHEIMDFVDGLGDLKDRSLRTIGDPEVRLAEDPVRILRAIKFSARLDLEISDPTWDAMCELAEDLEKAASPRVLEEILRLCRSGTAVAAFQMMRDCGALAVLIPQLEEYLGFDDDIPERAEPFWDLLGALDARVRSKLPTPTTGVLIALLFALPFKIALEEDGANEKEPDEDDTTLGEDDEVVVTKLPDARTRASVAWEVLQPLSEATRLSRKDFARARRVLVAQQNFTAPPDRFSEVLFARSEEFDEALTLFDLHSQARGVGSDIVEAWRERRDRASQAPFDEIEGERRRTRKKRRRRKKRRPSGGAGR